MASRYGVALVLTAFATGLSAPAARAEKPGALSPQTLKLPTGPASLKGLGESFSPNIALGGGSYSVPIQVPPALLAPSVSFSYSSGRGKGVLGLGWSLGVLKIYRTTDKGLPQFTEEDRFAVQGPSLNDELVLVDPATRTYRLKNEGAFALFVRDVANDTWVIRLPSGETLFLGTSTESRQQSSRGTYRWFLERKENQFCHVANSGCETLAVEYDYFRDKNHVYLAAIRYQLYAPEQNRVDFIYDPQDRPDVFSDYTYGHADTTRRRLKRIDVIHGSRLLRHYDLEYEDQDLFSVLSSVTLTGEHGEQMPALQFRYVQPSHRGIMRTMQHTPPLEGLLDGRSTLEDVTGDGLPDLLIGEPGAYRYYENLDGMSFAPAATPIGNSPDRGLEEPDAVLADINGDGFRDLVHAHDTGFRFYPGGNIRKGVFLRYGTAQALTPASGTLDAHLGSPQVKLTDLNFDGRTDYLFQTVGGVQNVLNTKANRLRASATTDLPNDIDFADPSLMLTDFNGDGHLDFVLVQIDWTRGRVRVWLGTGEGHFLAERTVPVPLRGDPREFFLQDVNRDGQADLLRISGSTVHYYLNTGKMRFSTARGDYLGVPATYQTLKQMFADMNGNGTADIVWVTQDYKLRYLDLMAEPHFGLLTEVDNGMGQVTSIAYDTSTQFMIEAKASGKPWKTPMASPMPVVRSISVSDSFYRLGFPENVTLTRFTYRDGYYDGKEREFRGFAKVITEEVGDADHPTQITETRLHVGRNLETGVDEEILKGKAYLALTRDTSGVLYQSVETVWEQRWLCQEALEEQSPGSPQVLPNCLRFGSGDQWPEHKDELVAFAQQTAALTGTWEGTDDPKYTYSTTDEVDVWGNVLAATNYGEVRFFAGLHEVGDPLDEGAMNLLVGSDEVVTVGTYINNTDNWLLKLPFESTTQGFDGTTLAKERVFYDGTACETFPCAFDSLPDYQVSHGRVTRKEAWLVDESRWVNAGETAYNRAGQPVAQRDANLNVRRLSYDAATGMFLELEQVETEVGWLSYGATYDKGFGQIETATDFNGGLSQFAYDGLGRITAIADAHSSLTEPTQKFDYEYGDPVSLTTVQALVSRSPAQYHTTWVYTDGLGRERETKTAWETEAESPPRFIGSGWQVFSARGKPVLGFDVFDSGAVGLDGIPPIEAPPTGTAVTRTEYDLLGRTRKVFPPETDFDSTFAETRYLPWETEVFDERDGYEGTSDYPAISRVDGLGRLVEIVKYNDNGTSVQPLKWNVGYDLLGNITSITDPAGNERRYTYDSLKRLLTIADPNAGDLEYTYDDVGNMLSKVDGRGARIVWSYGLANRLQTQKMYKAGDWSAAVGSYQFYYDTPHTEDGALLPLATNVLGQVSRIVSPIGEQAFSYDELGRVLTVAQSLVDPDPPDSPAEAITEAWYSSTTYDPQGKVLSQDLPGGMLFKNEYNTRQLLTHFTGALAGGGTYSGWFTYDARGLPVRNDYGNGLSTCRHYDARQRLRQGRTTAASELPADISTGCGAPDPDSGPTCSTNADCGATEVCDASEHRCVAGDIANREYAYTPTGLISSITDLSPTRPQLPRLDATYRYDRLYQLIEADTPSMKTEYAYDTIQNLLSRTVTPHTVEPSEGVIEPPGGAFTYGTQTTEGIKGPNQVTSAFNGAEAFTYDDAGYMKSYNGFSLTWDVEGRLVEAAKPGMRLRWFYDYAGERRWKIAEVAGEPSRITKYPFGAYQERDGAPTWTLVAGGSMLGEVTLAPKPIPSLFELDDLITYGYDPESDLPPDPWQADSVSLREATEAFWSGQPVGPTEEVGRYFHRDHLGGPAHVTNAKGELVAVTTWHPYGLESHRRGFQPNYTFTGAEREPERDLGLIQMGARWYAPKLGRWLSADPLFVTSPSQIVERVFGASVYAYAFNNPMMFLDPSGLDPEKYYSEAQQACVLPEGMSNEAAAKREETGFPSDIAKRQRHEALRGSVSNPPEKDQEWLRFSEKQEELVRSVVPGMAAVGAVDDYVQGKIGGADLAVDLTVQAVIAALLHYTFKGGGPAPAEAKPGEFSIVDWSGYPEGVPKPKGPFKLVEGVEYDTARKAANSANNEIRRTQNLRGQPVDVHEVKPVKFGGSPTDPANKVILDRSVHRKQVTPFWNRLMKAIGG